MNILDMSVPYKHAYEIFAWHKTVTTFLDNNSNLHLGFQYLKYCTWNLLGSLTLNKYVSDTFQFQKL